MPRQKSGQSSLEFLWALGFSIILFIFSIYSSFVLAQAERELALSYKHYVAHQTSFFRQGEVSSGLSNLSLNFFHPLEKSWSYDFGLTYSVEEEQVYFRVKNLSHQWKVSPELFLQSGVLESDHSWHGDIWRNGLWNRRHNRDRLKAEEEGQLGFRFHYTNNKENKLGFRAFFQASPLSIPELGPQVKIENQRPVSKSPWFNPPATELLIGENRTPIRHSLDSIDYEELIFKPYIIVGAGLKGKDLNSQITYGYKPMNQVRFSAELSGQVEGNDTVGLYSDLSVHRDYHHLLTSETEWTLPNKLGRLMFSYTHETPVLEKVAEKESKRITQEFQTSQHFGVSWAKKLSFGHGVRVSFVETQGGDAKDSGYWASLIQNRQSLFEGKIQFHRAARVQWDWQNVLWKRPFRSSFEVTYDFLQKGAALRQLVEYSFRKNLQMQVSYQFLGLLTSEEVDTGRASNFLSSYRANDSVSLGVHYGF